MQYATHISAVVTKETTTSLVQNTPQFKTYSLRAQSELKLSVVRQVEAVMQRPHEILLKTTNGKRRPSSDTTNLTTDNVKI